jgi:hypothetical protein
LEPTKEETKSKDPFAKSAQEEKIEKFAFDKAHEADAIKAGHKKEDYADYEVPMKTKITQDKFWSDHQDHWEKSKIVEAKAVASTKSDSETAKALKGDPAPKVEETKKAAETKVEKKSAEEAKVTVPTAEPKVEGKDA